MSNNNNPVFISSNNQKNGDIASNVRRPFVLLDGNAGGSEVKQNKKIVDYTTYDNLVLQDNINWLASNSCAAVSRSVSFGSIRNTRESLDISNSDYVDVAIDYCHEGFVPEASRQDLCTDFSIFDNNITYKDLLITNSNTNHYERQAERFRVFDNLFRLNGVLCNSFESWYDDTNDDNEVEFQSSLSKNLNIPQNSSTNPIARKMKMNHLRFNHSPFDVDEIELTKGSLNTGKYTPAGYDIIKKSFSNVIIPKDFPVKKAPRKELSFTGTGVGKCSLFAGKTCGTFVENRIVETVQSEDDNKHLNDEHDDLCYDSDPSNLVSTRQSSKTKGSLFNYERLSKRVPHDFNIIDEVACTERVCELMQSEMLLVWHRKASDGVKHDPTVAVHAWIEHGSQLDSVLLQPKFCWRENYGKESSHDRSILNICSRFHSVDLLDIAKIVATDFGIDRQRFPFVKKSCSFLIQSFDRELVFEARNELERDEIVKGLKLLVARLGSKIIMGDGRVIDEFFSPMGNYVPGEIPAIFVE